MSRDEEGWVLTVDGTPQSHVNDALLTGDPVSATDLRFPYIRHMGHILECAWPEPEPITAVHLGAGGMTIPRFIAGQHPAARQQVIEIERPLVELVRRAAPLPRTASIRIRYGDAREQVANLPGGLRGTVDLVVVDIFAGAQTPRHVTSVEFYRELTPLLAPGALVLVNVADGHELRFARGQVATLREAIGGVQLITDPAVAKGRRFGNFVAVACVDEPRLDGLRRRLAVEFPPAVLLDERETLAFASGFGPVTDAAATPSPRPGRGIFTQRRSGGWT